MFEALDWITTEKTPSLLVGCHRRRRPAWQRENLGLSIYTADIGGTGWFFLQQLAGGVVGLAKENSVHCCGLVRGTG